MRGAFSTWMVRRGGDLESRLIMEATCVIICFSYRGHKCTWELSAPDPEVGVTVKGLGFGFVRLNVWKFMMPP